LENTIFAAEYLAVCRKSSTFAAKFGKVLYFYTPKDGKSDHGGGAKNSTIFLTL
jgi:hypothetical protein